MKKTPNDIYEDIMGSLKDLRGMMEKNFELDIDIARERQRLIDEATEHPWECKCNKCNLWHKAMGPER